MFLAHCFVTSFASVPACVSQFLSQCTMYPGRMCLTSCALSLTFFSMHLAWLKDRKKQVISHPFVVHLLKNSSGALSYFGILILRRGKERGGVLPCSWSLVAVRPLELRSRCVIRILNFRCRFRSYAGSNILEKDSLGTPGVFGKESA